MDKRWLFIGTPIFIFLALFAAVIFVLPFFLNADAFRSTVEGQLSSTLGRSVTMGKLSFSLVHGTLSADDLAVSDDPTFSSVPFLQAKKLEVGVEIFPLLLHHQVHITDLTLDTPSIQLIEHAGGKWNFSSLGPDRSASTSSVSALSVGQIKIINGSALVSSIPQTAKPFEFSELAVTARQFSYYKSFPFELSGKLPAGGTLNITGEAGPIPPTDASQTPFHAKLQVREFDLVAAGVVEKGKGISLISDVDADLASDGVTFNTRGKIKASRLQLAPKGSPSLEPVDIDYILTQNLATRERNLSDAAIHIGSADAHLKGGIKPSPDGLTLDLHLSAPALPVDQVERLLPSVGIRLPSGSSLHGGTLTANIAISGPATAPTMTGPVEISNTTLVGFDLGANSEGLNLTQKTGDTTEIRVLRATVNSSAQTTRLIGIYAELPQYGTATGDGSVAPAGELDFHLNAKIYTNGAGTPGTRVASASPGLVESSLPVNPKTAQVPSRSITLTITGTAANPLITARTLAAPH